MRAYVSHYPPYRLTFSSSRVSSLPRMQHFAAAATFSVLLALLCLFGRPAPVMAGITASDTPASAKAEVLSHSLNLSREHGYLVLNGEARNLTRRDLPQLEAVAEFFDSSGRLVSVESALVKLGTIPAGDESPFEISVPDDRSVRSYRLRFRAVAGSMIPSRVEL